MTVEELLKPRYEVIADYPNILCKIGDILELKDTFPKGWFKITVGCNEDEFTFSEMTLNRYPHLFKRLEWWKKRSIEDMPTYVKFISDNKIEFVLKVERYIFHKDSTEIWAFEYLWEQEKDIKRMSINGWNPAIETEYNQYINL